MFFADMKKFIYDGLFYMIIRQIPFTKESAKISFTDRNMIQNSYRFFNYYQSLTGDKNKKIIQTLEFSKKYWKRAGLWSTREDMELSKLKHEFGVNINIQDMLRVI